MHKTLLALAFASFSTAAYGAIEPKNQFDVCANIRYEPYKIKCLSTIQDKYFDKYAVGVCTKVRYEPYVISCLETVADKSFAYPALEVCHSISYEPHLIQCLSNAAQKRECISNREIREELEDAISNIESGRPERARLRLLRLRSDIAACGE